VNRRVLCLGKTLGAPRAMTENGGYVRYALESDATNLVAGETTGFTDIFVHDLVASTTIRVSVDSLGRQANGPSFKRDVFVHDLR
jgi:hypothetical protein